MPKRQDFLQTIDSVLNSVTSDQEVMALLVVKLKRFQEVNKAYGIKTGDVYLQQVEKRLQNILRPVDVMSKIGDNEFGLLLPSLLNRSHAILAANKIISDFEDPVECGDHIIEPRLVIGVVVAPEHGNSHDELMLNAVLAIAQAEQKQESYAVYCKEPESVLPPSLIVEREMHHAFEYEEFDVYYQPKIDLRYNRVSGVEVLLRWDSPKFGAVNTQKFIDILEDSSLLITVTKWTLNQALRRCQEFQDYIRPFKIAVNLSPALLNDIGIVGIVEDAVNIWGIDPASLLLEVTEGAMMKNPDLSLQILQDINAIGVGISIDDFGTGYSSLSYLKNLPASELKIDKSFVLNMLQDERDENIVKATIDLAHNLNLDVVAEGVELEAVYARLVELGCDYAQGFYMGKAMTYKGMLDWFKESEWGLP